MGARSQTICLNMIVKNEAPVIRRCLESVRRLIDYWVIVDTGSTDSTQSIIREYLEDIPGDLHERPWENFAHNRTEALELARGKAAYTLVIDADEIVEVAADFMLPALRADSYNIQVRYGGCTYLRRQLVRSDLPWRYEGVVHEYMTCEQARTEEFLKGVETVPHHDGARARDPLTYRRDALVLEKALLDDPANTRYVFYLAQSHRDAGDLELALRNYKRRVEMGGWAEEVWYSLYQVAHLKERMHEPWPEVMESYLAAWQKKPDRAGPLYHIAMHYQSKGEYHSSYLFLSQAVKISTPPPNALFVERPLYDYKIQLEYAVAAYYVGDHASAIDTNNRLLRSPALPAQAVDQVICNRRFSLDALFPKPKRVARKPRIRVVIPFHNPGPEFDVCVDSLVRQDYDNFTAIFVDEGSHGDQSDRIPLENQRFSLLHSQTGGPQPQDGAYLGSGSDEVALTVLPHQSLADQTTLSAIADAFTDPACLLAYGQYRLASGAIGSAEPANSETDFDQRGAALAGSGVVACRAPLLSHSDRFAAAGYRHTRFYDVVWTSETASPRPAAPAVLTGKLPLISCLMVTSDRLSLARESIQSFAWQTYEDRELVIVTDGEQRFRRALERYVHSIGIAPVRFIYPEGERLTLGRLRNLSLEAARGEIVCQWDDDDYSHPERLMRQAEHMFRGGADACFLTDHLQFLQNKRILCWIDWTLGGTAAGAAQFAPGTLMMKRDTRFRYPEDGPHARHGEDSDLLYRLHSSSNVVPFTNAGHLYLYRFHGRNTFSKEHHYRLSNCRTSNEHIQSNAERIREATTHYPIPKPCLVVGREGPSFALR